MSRSLTQLPNNTNTSQTAEVYSATGFGAGDLVYYQGGDYKPAGSLTTSNNVTFDNTANLNTSSLLANSAIGSVFPSTSGTPTGSSGGRFAAVLTNGNIVQAFYNTGPTPGGGTAKEVYFQIVNTSGVVQVAPTRIGSQTPNYVYSMEVVALTGGGFVVVYIFASEVTFAIYSNTGSLTTAVQADTGIATNNVARVRATPLANGGFAIAAYNSGTNSIVVRSYNAIGTFTTNWISTSTPPMNIRSSYGLSSRSDSSVIVAFVTSSSDRVSYFLYNSSGALITSNFFGISVSNSFIPVDIACLTDGTTYVISYFNQSSPTLASFRLLPSSNTIGSAITIPSANVNSGNSVVNANYSTSVLALASGGFAMVFADYFNTLNYAFFNASGTAVSGTNGSGTLPITIPIARSSIDYYVTMVEISGFVNLYWSIGLSDQAQSNPNQSFAQINSTTYALVPRTSTVSGILGSSSVAAGSAVVASATPANTKFYPATTTSGSYSRAFGATIVAPTTVSSAQCNGIASCTLPNGQFVIAYMLRASPYTVFANVYSSAGALLTTLTVGTGISTLNGVRVAALSSGKFVVGWANESTSQYSVSLYSSTFTQIGTTKTGNLYTTYNSNQWTFDLVGLGNNSDRYVVAFVGTSTYPLYAVYDNTNTVIVGPTFLIFSNYYNTRVAADPFGGFAISTTNPGGSSHLTILIQTGATTYSNTSTYFSSFANIVGADQQTSVVYANNGYYQAVSNNGSALGGFHVPTNSSNPGNLSVGSLYNSQAANTATRTQTLGLNGNGNLIYVGINTTSDVAIVQVFGGVSFTTGISSASTSNITNNGNLPITTNTTTYGCFSICPSTGNNFVLAHLDSSNIPTFAIYNSVALSGTFPITAGVTTSNAISLSPIASTSTSVVSNTVLAGVAVTGATAGSTGQVAINGLAQLNSNYPSGTNQAFDFTGQVIDGVKGVINGRTVNMQGNS